MPDTDFYTPSQLETQRAIAKALLEESGKTPTGTSGHFTAASPLAPFAQMAEALAGGYINKRATQGEIGRAAGKVVAPVGGDDLSAGPGSVSDATPDTAAPDADTAAPAAYAPMIEDAAMKSGLDRALLTKQIKQESGFNPKSHSPAGAMGISQFMPGTARDLGVDPWKPESAIPGQAKYDSDMIAKFGGNTGLGLAAYNWGPGNMQKWIDHGANPAAMPAETRNYVKIITGQPIEAWLAKTKQPGPQSAVTPPQMTPQSVADMAQKQFSATGGTTPVKALPFSGEPAQAPIQMPDSPAAMSTALAPEAAAGGSAPAAGGAEAPMKMAGGPAPARPGLGVPGTIGAPGITPPRPRVTREQAIQAAIDLDHNPTNPVALSTYQAYQMQNQPQVGTDPYGRQVLFGRSGPPMTINPLDKTMESAGKGTSFPVYRRQGEGPGGQPVMRQVPGGNPAPAAAPAAPEAPEEDVPSLKFAPEGKGAGAGKGAEALPAEITKGPEAAKAEKATMLGTKPPEAAAGALPFDKVAGTKLPPAPSASEATDLEDMTPAQRFQWIQNQENAQKATQHQNQVNIDDAMKTNKAVQDAARISLGAKTDIDVGAKLIEDPRLQALMGPGHDLKRDWSDVKAFLGNQDANLATGLDQTFQKVISSGIIKTLKADYGGLGQIRNKEIELSDKATLSPKNTFESNMAILEIAKRTFERNVALGKISNAYMAGKRWDENGKPIPGKTEGVIPTQAEMNKILNEYIEHHPIFDNTKKDKSGKTEMDRYISVFDKKEGEEEAPVKSGGARTVDEVPEGFKKRPKAPPVEVPMR